MKKIFYVLLSSVVFAACNGNNSTDQNTTTQITDQSSTDPANINYSVVNVYPHDTAAYTEGLFWENGFLYESTGGNDDGRKSFVIKRSLKDIKPIQQLDIPSNFFGEGITILGDKLFELTWQEHKVFVYDAKTFQKTGEFSWPQEGWGMTTDGKSLIISTGSSNVYYVNPADFSVEKIVGVSNNYGPLAKLNELEYVDGFIYANVWQTTSIVKIDPNSGKVVAVIDLSDIKQKSGKDFALVNDPTGDKVLNGIAYNPTTKTFYVTGKDWPYIYELKLQ